MKKFILLAAVLAAMMLALTACSGAQQSTDAGQKATYSNKDINYSSQEQSQVEKATYSNKDINYSSQEQSQVEKATYSNKEINY